MAQISLNNVSKVYNSPVKAVNNLSLDVADGEFMVIVGPSGCGKTTTLRMIAGLEDITLGTISIDGVVINDVPPKNRDVAMVFQTYALYPHMNVFHNIAFGLKLRKVQKPEVKKRVNNVAQMLGIQNLLKCRPGTLSGGQQQRVSLGRAIVGNPRVFLFDEPLNNLDAQLRTTTRLQLKQLHSKLKTTSIYVTHDQTEAMTMGDRICVLKDGIVQQIGTPQDIYDRPLNRFVAGFFGTAPMNFFKGKVMLREGKASFVLGENNFTFPSERVGSVKDNNMLDVNLGIRPEHLSLKLRSSSNENSLNAEVLAVEHLGLFKMIYLKSGFQNNIIVAMPPDEVIEAGVTTPVYFDMTKVHLFDLNNNTCTLQNIIQG